MIVVRRASERFETRQPGIVSRHSFSSGAHYDPANTHFGPLLAVDEHLLAAGSGFARHRHRELEIVTWLLAGTLEHLDGSGVARPVPVGTVQYLGAGAGTEHSERAAGDRPARFVQMWLQPDERGGGPRYEQRPVSRGRWIPLASGRRPAAIELRQGGATLWLGRPGPEAPIEIPAAPFGHVLVTHGVVDIEGVGLLQTGDAARITHGKGRRLSADAPAEVLVWEMHADATA